MTFNIRYLPGEKCFECGHDVHAVASPTATCVRCGAIHGIDDEKHLRSLTLGHRAELAGDHDRMREFKRVHRDPHFARAKTAAAGK